MNFTQIQAILQQGLATLRALAPLAQLGGPVVANVAAYAASLAEIGQNIMDKIADGTVVATSDDEATIKALIADIQTENDGMDARINAG